jgi:sugar phosphate isomerase/epimerase
MVTLGKNAISLNPTVTNVASLVLHKAVAREAGFDAIELAFSQIDNYLEAGYTEDELKKELADVNVVGTTGIYNLERQGPDFELLKNEVEKEARMARIIGSGGVAMVTGPLDYRAVQEFKRMGYTRRYSGLMGMDLQEQIRLSARNAAALADIAAQYGVVLYIEALCWAPISKISQILEILDRAERDNLKIIVDFFHATIAGETPEQIARINKKHIYAVHVCDTLANYDDVPVEYNLRNVATGSGIVNLREWVDAVKATGYDGWWSGELFDRKQLQGNPFIVAKDLKKILDGLVRG